MTFLLTQNSNFYIALIVMKSQTHLASSSVFHLVFDSNSFFFFLQINILIFESLIFP